VVSNGGHKIVEGQVDIVRPYKNNVHTFRPHRETVLVDLI
jgi:hypothetical protein